MQITYDPEAKPAYIRLTDDAVAYTVCPNDTLSMDIAEDGTTVVGIEIIGVIGPPELVA